MYDKADDSNMDPRLRRRRIRMVKKLVDAVPSERIPELENFVMELMPPVEDEPDEIVDEAVRLIEEHNKQLALLQMPTNGLQ